MQYFKGDDLEKRFDNAGSDIISQIGVALDDFFDNAYDAMPLGDVLHDIARSPLADAIRPEIFRASFNTIYTAFTVAGSFESYLTVFRKIFGETVDVEFTVPAPGKLNIDIIADELEEFNFVARHIDDNMYLYDNVIWYDGIDDPGGNIIFQTVKGFHSQYELEQMLYEMVPAGIFTEINLTFSV